MCLLSNIGRIGSGTHLWARPQPRIDLQNFWRVCVSTQSFGFAPFSKRSAQCIPFPKHLIVDLPLWVGTHRIQSSSRFMTKLYFSVLSGASLTNQVGSSHFSNNRYTTGQHIWINLYLAFPRHYIKVILLDLLRLLKTPFTIFNPIELPILLR